MVDLNYYLIEIKARQTKFPEEKSLLIQEAFILWYMLVEGEEFMNFTESDITRMLYKNSIIFKESYFNDPDYNFIVGWMLSISPWFYEGVFDEEDWKQMLLFSYKTNPKNKLFKWAMRGEFSLSKSEVAELSKELEKNFDSYYAHGNFIKSYFIDVIMSSLSY